MHSRQSLTDVFSTFARFDGDRFKGWTTDPKLRRSMLNRLKQTPEAKTSENFWVLYWHKLWSAASEELEASQARLSLAEGHLSAYLQEACYWVAQKTLARFNSTHYNLSDYFQTAIAALPKILRGYNPDRNSTLKDYANVAFKSTIRDSLRASQEIDICTNWALLRKLSKKRLGEALEQGGLISEEIARYQLAWTCFKECYVPTQANKTRQLTKPDRATLEAIARLYNSERHTQIDIAEPERQPETIEQWLANSAKKVRSYLYPKMTSLNAPKPQSDSREVQDLLSATASESLLVELANREEVQQRQARKSELTAVLATALDKFNAQNRELMHLYYSQELTQQQIAKHMKTQQYTISRRLARSRKTLLDALVKWSQQTLNLSLSSHTIAEASDVLEEWLQGFYSQNNH
ncbi:sigma-70 family RNA polymerase sigma factor [Lusitaniella coriacea LEGE 07157]|uniref:Sigma-70 family RNA polymerase sigma factor n=1 Tax=Lusitaniella coriacea LEGE 07157 TaxID=945747 RepID=A0A8J7JB28_9CYAN|nr:sigma-70 family RNA polymerase sigma factor [Lusitaniella coriacea]MBE9116710.1 sigma-70 family RNA polymerase sigma factor [Lusitaniella coriacea LEGE 07157]